MGEAGGARAGDRLRPLVIAYHKRYALILDLNGLSNFFTYLIITS